MEDDYNYPSPEDPELQKKLYQKREFYVHRIAPKLKPMTPEEIDQYRMQVCKKKPKLQSYQAFLSEFMNPETPYMGLLVFHGTGSGKTFASISIAERFKEQVQRYNTKIVILVPGPILKEQFKFDLATICTNYSYMTPELASRFTLLSAVEKKKAIEGALRVAGQFYRIMSYKSFHRKVMGEKVTRDGQEVRQFSSNQITSLDNTVLIVDEAHNFTNNEYGQALMQIRKKSTNLRVVLLTATPMKNLADEVIPLLNFIRPLEDPIERARVFQGNDFDMMFTEDGQAYLRRMATGYVSFYRGGNPHTFARRKDIGEIPDQLLFTPLVRCPMMPFQDTTYKRVVGEHKDSLDKNSEAVANFVFPSLDKDNQLRGLHGKEGIKQSVFQLSSGVLTREIQKAFKMPTDTPPLYLSKKTKQLTGAIFSLPHLSNFSIKFARCMENIIGLPHGTVFVYSNLVQLGTNIFREVLLSNGFLEYDNEQKYILSPTTRNHDMKSTYADHVKKGTTDSFRPATFIVVSGGGSDLGESKDVPEEKIAIIQKVFNHSSNINGERIKVVLGSRVVNEGVTLENVRQVHILDVHYHLGRVDQVIGRAIRQCRHINVTEQGKPSPEVEVFRYSVSYADSTELTREELLYKKAEIKFTTIKSVERILKEMAIDCPLNFAANQVAEEVWDGCKSIREVMKNPSLKKQLCPARCEFEDCRFRCGDHALNLAYYDRTRNIYQAINKSHLDFGTFSRRNAKLEIDFCKSIIKDLFRLRDRYSFKLLKQEVLKFYEEDKIELFDEFFLLRALTELMPVSDGEILNFTDTVTNRYNVSGFISFKDGFYTFQPKDGGVTRDYSSNRRRSISDFLNEKNKTIQRYHFPQETNLKPENFIVGILDDDATGKEVFKIRPPRAGNPAKKRALGVPTLKGSVCSLSRSVPQLKSLLSRLGVKNIPEHLVNRITLCEMIKKRLIFLETNAGEQGIPNKRYLIIPDNHPTLPYPLNKIERKQKKMKR